MTSTNHIRNVAIIGASGNCGKFITESLLKTGKHTVTAITRVGSESQFPDGVATKAVNYSKQETIVEALKGHDALVITLSGHTPKETEGEVVKAAAEAGVPWILPNDWSPDTANEDLVNDVFILQPKVATHKLIEELGKSSYISVSTGYWYEWSLAMGPAYGIDFRTHSAILFDEGDAKISTSTWPQVGRAVAALLSLPIRPSSQTDQRCLENFSNKVVYVKSFTVSQKDMLESALRVTGTKVDDWEITKESSHERFAAGALEIKEGKRIGFAKLGYTRVFFPDGAGNIEHKGTLNGLLNLPEEDIDEATRVAMERSKLPSWLD